MRHATQTLVTLALSYLATQSSALAMQPPPAPPAETSTQVSEVTPTARFYLDVAFAGTPNHEDGTFTIVGNYQYVTYYNQNYELCLSRRHVSSGGWTTITFEDCVVPPTADPDDEDSHDSPHVAISPADNRIHLAYGHHNDPLRYRISDAGAAVVADIDFTEDLFSSERDYLNSTQTYNNVTYPDFVTLETNGNLAMFWRQGSSGWGDSLVSKYNNDGTWTTKRWIVQGRDAGTYDDPTNTIADSTRRNAYHRFATSADGKIHTFWCWRETPSSISTNHSICFASSSDGTQSWQNTAGTTLTLPVKLASPGEISDFGHVNFNWKLYNNGGIAVDSQGNTHLAVVHAEDDSGTTPQRIWHYVRIGTTWSRTMLPYPAGFNPAIYVDRSTKYNLAGTGSPPNLVANDTVYITSRNTSGKLAVYASQRYSNADPEEETWDLENLAYNWVDWLNIHTSSATYSRTPRGRINSSGNLVLLGHVQPSPLTSSSPLHVITINVDNNSH